jgi:hypothetical protein
MQTGGVNRAGDWLGPPRFQRNTPLLRSRVPTNPVRRASRPGSGGPRRTALPGWRLSRWEPRTKTRLLEKTRSNLVISSAREDP